MPGMCVRNRSLVFPMILEGNRFLLNFIENRGSERWCDFSLVSVNYWENWNPYWVDWALHSTQHSIVEHQSRNRKTLQKSRRPQISLLSPSIGMTGSYLWREQLQWSDISARMFCSFILPPCSFPSFHPDLDDSAGTLVHLGQLLCLGSNNLSKLSTAEHLLSAEHRSVSFPTCYLMMHHNLMS